MSIRERLQSTDFSAPRVMMLILTLILVCTGIIMVFSASVGESFDSGLRDSIPSLSKDLGMAALGIGSGLLIYFFGSPKILRSRGLRILLALATVALVIATFVTGETVNGAKRWINLGFARLQPTEFIKIFMVVNTCSIWAEYQEGVDGVESFLKFLAVVIFPVGLLFILQSDLGSMIIIAVGVIAALAIGGIKLRYILGFFGLIAIVGVFAVLFTEYRSNRMYFADPWSDGQNGRDNGLQLIRSLYAFAKGGLFGVGPGASTERLIMPEAETDFIYAIVGEEFGFVGSVAIALLFFLLLVCGLIVSQSADNVFAHTMSSGLIIMLVFQAFLNMCCVTGLVPTTGKPLPFLSSGGSSMVASILMISLVLSITRPGLDSSVYDRRRENLRIVTASGSNNSDAPRKRKRATSRSRR